MNTARIKASINEVVNAYKNKLSAYPDNVFQIMPPIGGWSYSEVYTHIFDSSLLSLMAIENCTKGNPEDKPTTFGVKVILFLGFLPPAKKYEVPEKLKNRVKKISKKEAIDFIQQFQIALNDVFPSIAKAGQSSKTKHPILGYLNAEQWLRFIEIHLKHHLKQLGRIEKSFRH